MILELKKKKNCSWTAEAFLRRAVSPIDQASVHYGDDLMGAMASQIPSLTIVYSTVYSGADQSKHQNSASLAFVQRIHRGPVNSPHKWPVTRKMFPFDDVIISAGNQTSDDCALKGLIGIGKRALKNDASPTESYCSRTDLKSTL